MKIEGTLGGNPLEDIKILIVDNDERLVLLVRNILKAFGFREIDHATDGEEAKRFMRTISYDLIICDWQMEPMNGLQFIEFLRKNPSSPNVYIPVIMLSGRAERENIERARDIGATEFLAKPFTIAAFRERIISVIDAPREFVFAENFVGPNRRRRNDPPPGGNDRRHD